MKIVVTFAVASEFAQWRRRAGFVRINSAGTPAYRTRNGQDEIYAVITGVGTRHLGSELRELFASQADLCIASGFGGALKTKHRAGSILAARTVKKDSSLSMIHSDAALVSLAAECGANIVDFFYTTNSVVNSSSEKQRLGEIADAVDMESFQVLSEACRAGVPALAVRAISDAAQNDLPLNFDRVIDEYGQLRWAALLFELAKAPRQLPAFARFGADALSAARNLASFLDTYVRIVARERSRFNDVDECRDLSRIRPGEHGNRACAGHF